MADKIPFDYIGAKKVGYSDDEINSFLKSKYNFDFDISAAKKSGYSDNEISDFISKYETDVKKKVSSNDIPKPVAGSSQSVSNPSPTPLQSASNAEPVDENDIISQAQKVNELSNRQIPNVSGGTGGTGVSFSPDEAAIAQANQIKKNLYDKGYKDEDIKGIVNEFSDFPHEAFGLKDANGQQKFSKESLLQLRKENPIEYNSTLNNIKNTYSIAKAGGVQAANEYNAGNHAAQSYGDLYNHFNNQQKIINTYLDGEEKQKALDRLKESSKQFITAQNPEFLQSYNADNEFNKILTPTQYAGLKTLQVFDPAKYQVRVNQLKASIDGSDISDYAIGNKYLTPFVNNQSGNIISQMAGKEQVLRELGNEGRENSYKYLQSLRNNYQKQLNTTTDPAVQSQIVANDKIAADAQNKLIQDAKQDDVRYPITASLKLDNQVKEIMQDPSQSVLGNIAMHMGHTFNNIPESVENIIGDSPSLQLRRMGEKSIYDNTTYLPSGFTDSNAPYILQYPKDVEDKIKSIQNDPTLSDEYKTKRSHEILNNSIPQTITNPEYGTSKNVFSKATVYKMGGFLGDVATIVGTTIATGGETLVAKIAPMFLTSQADYYKQAVEEGKSDPNGYANLHAMIVTAAGLISPRLDYVKKVAGVNSTLGKAIENVGDKEWNNIVSNSADRISRIKNSVLDAGKETVKQALTFGAGVSVANDLADNAFYNKNISDMGDHAIAATKDMLIGSLPLTGFHVVTGFMKTPQAQKALVWELGDHKDIQLKLINEAEQKGDITKAQADQRRGVIEQVAGLIDKVPKTDKKGNLLTDDNRIDYLYNLYVKERAKGLKGGLPDKEKAEVDDAAKKADDLNGKILNGETEEKPNINDVEKEFVDYRIGKYKDHKSAAGESVTPEHEQHMREFIGDNVGTELDKSIEHVESNLKTQKEFYNNNLKGDILSSGKEKKRVQDQIEGYKQELAYLNNLKEKYDKASDVSHENTPSGIKPTEEASDIPDKVQGSEEGDVVKVKSFKKGDGGTKGIFEGEDGKLYKSTERTQIRQNQEGEYERMVIPNDVTKEYEILSDLQDNPHVPKIGKEVVTSEGKAFEIEKLDEVETLSKKEFREVENILADLNSKGYFVNDIVTVMRRPKTGELVVVDFSNGMKDKSLIGDHSYKDNVLHQVRAKLSQEAKDQVELEDISKSRKKEAHAFLDDAIPNQYILTQRPPSIGTHPTEGLQSIEETTFNGRKAWTLTYDRPLSEKEIYNYELRTPLDAKKLLGEIVMHKMGHDYVVDNVTDSKVTLTRIEDGERVQEDMSAKEFTNSIASGRLKFKNEPTNSGATTVKEGEAKTEVKDKVVGSGGDVDKNLEVVGSEFDYNGKTYVVKNVESNGVHAKIKGEDKSPLKLILPIQKYNEITGKNIEAPKPIIITPELQAEREIIKKAEAVKYRAYGGRTAENGREYIDRNIADGYNKVITIKQGAVNKYYLDNERNGLQLPISGDLRKYAELAIKKIKEHQSLPTQEVKEAHTTAQEHGFKEATHAINAVNKDFGTDYKTVQEIPEEQLQASSDKRTMNEATQEAAKDLSDHTTQLINEEGITLDNLKDLKHLFNGFPYTAEDYASVENELRRQTESNGNAGQTGEAGTAKPTSDNAPTGFTENSQTTDSSQRETTQADTEKVNIPEDVTPDPNTAKQIADKLRQWAKLVEGDNTSFKSDLLAIPKSVISTLLKGAANIIEAGGTIKEAIDDFIENVKSYAKANQPDFDEKNLRNDVRDLFREIGIVTNDEELRAKTKEELTKYITKEGRKQLAELSRTASQNGTIKEAFSLSREIGHFLANSPIFKNKVFKGIVNAFHPFAFDTDGSARKAYMKIRNENSELNRQLEVLDNKLRAQMKAWNKVPKLDRQGFILSMENPEKYGSVAPEYEKYAKAYRALMDHAFDLISSVRDVNKIEDYFAHFWQDPKKADKVLKQINGNKPLEGSKSFLKQRFYNDYMEGIRNGLVPLTDNPGEIVQLAMRNAMRFKFAHDILGDLKGNGIVSYHENPSSTPEGWRKINDNLFNPNLRDKISESGYYAPEPVANLINNFTSKGLFGGDGLVGTISNSIRWLNNLKNLFQLGFSPFHVATTTLETNVNGIAQAIKDFTTFKPERMGSALLQTVKTLSQVRTVQMVIKGNQIIRDYRNGNMTEDVQMMVAAGGRTGRQKIYSLDAWYNMNKAWNALTVDGGVNTTKENVSNGLKLLTNAVGVIPEVIMKPVMEHYVAALKIAGHSEALSKEIIRNPTMDGEKLLFKSQRLWDDMDDSLGNVVYDNYFWNKTVKDVGFSAIRSLGWTGGTIKKIGKAVGGAVDSFADIQNTDEGLKVNKGSLLKGEGLNIRSAWMVALPLTVGVFGGMLHKMLSGQNPKELEDYFFPWDGTYNPDGTKHRVSLPSYLKDIKGYATNFGKTVGNKLSPFFHEVYELLNNQDYYGTQIVNPNDPAYQKGVDILQYETKSFTPFSFRKQPGQGVGINPGQERQQHTEQFFGLMPAAKEEGRSKLENAIVAEARKNYHNEAISKETRERIDNRIIVKDLLRSGKSYNEIPKEIREKANYTPDGLRKVEKIVHLDPYMYKFKTLNAEQQLKLWGQMSEEEKRQYTKYLHKTETFSNLKAEKPEVFEINPEYVKYFAEMRKYKDLPKE